MLRRRSVFTSTCIVKLHCLLHRCPRAVAQQVCNSALTLPPSWTHIDVNTRHIGHSRDQQRGFFPTQASHISAPTNGDDNTHRTEVSHEIWPKGRRRLHFGATLTRTSSISTPQGQCTTLDSRLLWPMTSCYSTSILTMMMIPNHDPQPATMTLLAAVPRRHPPLLAPP